jgi:hypothetical protein
MAAFSRGGFFGLNLMDTALIAGGAIGAELVTGQLAKYVPAQLSSGWGRVATKAAVGIIGLPFVLKAVKQPKLAKLVALGAGVSVALDVIRTFMPQLAQGDYVMEGYEPSDALAGDAYGDDSDSLEGMGGMFTAPGLLS